MSLALVLAVGVDSSLLANQKQVLQSAGYHFVPARSMGEALTQLRDADFDLILLGHSIPIESRERMTFLIRASGTGMPVVCVTDSAGGHDGFADATIRVAGDDLLPVMEELLAARKDRRGSAACEAHERPQLHLLEDVRMLQMLWPRNTSKQGGRFQ